MESGHPQVDDVLTGFNRNVQVIDRTSDASTSMANSEISI